MSDTLFGVHESGTKGRRAQKKATLDAAPIPTMALTSAVSSAVLPVRAVIPHRAVKREITRKTRDLSHLAQQMEAAKLELALADSAESDAARREAEARERATAAVVESTVAGNELLTLRYDGHRGSLWAFAPGVFDNMQISWTDVEVAAAQLAEGVRRTLVDDCVDDSLLSYLRMAPYAAHWTGATRGGANSDVVRLKAFVSPAGCSALRNAVDAERDRTTDTGDHFAQHTLGLTLGRLAALIGPEAVEQVQRLPMALLSQRREEATDRARMEVRALRDAGQTSTDSPVLREALDTARSAAEAMRMAETEGFAAQVYLRRYSRDTRPWLNFHTDRSVVTVNVALADDTTHEGGRLHAVLHGAHCIVEREEGEATVHTDDVMHAVSAMRSGVRYSLVLLFFPAHLT